MACTILLCVIPPHIFISMGLQLLHAIIPVLLHTQFCTALYMYNIDYDAVQKPVNIFQNAEGCRNRQCQNKRNYITID